MPLPLSPDPKQDLTPGVAEALRAWGRLEMTPGQQAEVLRWIVNDLCECLTIIPPGLNDNQSGYTAGQRRVGIVLSTLTGRPIRLSTPEGKE